MKSQSSMVEMNERASRLSVDKKGKRYCLLLDRKTTIADFDNHGAASRAKELAIQSTCKLDPVFVAADVGLDKIHKSWLKSQNTGSVFSGERAIEFKPKAKKKK